MRDFGIRVGHPAHHTIARVQAIGIRHQSVERRVFSLRKRRVGELHWRTDIAGGIDAFVRGLMKMIDLHSAFVEFDASGFQAQTFGVGDPAGGDEYLVKRGLFLFPA